MKMKLEVLVATMKQSNLELHNNMGLKCNVLLTNQCQKWGYFEEHYDYGTVRMISSDSIGVGVNRNLGISMSQGEILLFADDDVVYYDGTLSKVRDAFWDNSDADVIVFGMDMTRGGRIYKRCRCKNKKVHIWNLLNYGACRIAVKKKSIEKYNISFSTLFGGGACYGAGEDSLFLLDCIRAGLKIYSNEYVLGVCARDSSSWFTGYNEKYYFDKGAWIGCAFPRIKHVLKWYFVWKYIKRTDLSISKIVNQINSGIKDFESR